MLRVPLAAGIVTLAAGCGAADARRTEALEAENAQLRRQVAALAVSVNRLDAHVFPRPPVRTQEWQGFDEMPYHVFWQRRFATERRDEPWATAAETALRAAAVTDLGAGYPVAIECHSTVCRIEADCAGARPTRQPQPQAAPEGGGGGQCLWALFQREYKGTIDSGLNASWLTTVPQGQVVLAIRAGIPPGPPDLQGGP